MISGQESAKVNTVPNNPLQSTIEPGCDESKPTNSVVGGAHAFILRVSIFLILYRFSA